MPESITFRHRPLGDLVRSQLKLALLPAVWRHMPRRSPPHAPLSPSQLTEHFGGTQALVRRAVESREQQLLSMESPVPGSGENDVWELRLFCSPELVGYR